MALIIGITGACRREELCKLKVTNIKEEGSVFIGKIAETTNSLPRTFVIADRFHSIVKKYAALRPIHATTDGFFVNYNRAKSTVQNIGINKFWKMPSLMAEY